MRKNQFMNEFLTRETEMPLHVVHQQLKGHPHELQDMKEICLITKNEANLCTAMEYLYDNGLIAELKELIDKTKHAESEQLRKTSRIYQIMYNRKKLKAKQLKPDDPVYCIKYVNRIRLKDTDYRLLILRDLVQIYCYFDIHQYGKIGTFNEKIKQNLAHIKDPLQYQLFKSRLDETLFVFHWKRNEMILSRKYGYRLLTETNNIRKKIDIHNILAQGYLFESYEQAMNHICVAIEIAEQLGVERAIYGLKNYTLAFIAAYYKQTEGISSQDMAERAHIALAENDIDTCVRILEDFETLSPFQQYYLGLAKQDKHLLRTSYQRFIEERDDYFYAKLPLEALNTLDE
ncbi:AimR family lysis-lysogeny pheromone receptor [Gracilibacillus caseinilyticus]|uniref:AimR family lysis-lysogeny pheromone receptor n=1 Tax=Gracilibacillus caseinilyticus TaxID=2932256 RepID=A0ABY4F167_9BACI|nr:AimR family lysis-lysogeny pheromone receptor [Gracilibacillus caseinilyticus]UOQ50224.1 AimR family lysis-lysogeny pheromone receptor [Gracilibacillus caseinilyticus]